MSESTETVANRALPDPEDEWIPRELIEAQPGPLFRRFAPSRNTQAEPVEHRPANDQPKPVAPPPIDPRIAQRLAEVERTVARAATAADQSASNVRTIVMRNRPTGQNLD